jgi:hypothetical protein
MSRLYAYAEQTATVRSLLDAAGIGPGFQGLMPVAEPDGLRGLDGGTFAIIRNHARPVPLELLRAVADSGMVVIMMSDEFARAKAETARMPRMPG